MSRYNLYGEALCRECEHYGKSTKCPHFRCRYPDNMRTNWLGAIYMKHPDEINWNRKCKWFKKMEK